MKMKGKPFRIRKVIHPDSLTNRTAEPTNQVQFFSEYLNDLGSEVPLKMDEVATFIVTVAGKPITELRLRVHEFFFGDGTVSYLLVGPSTPETEKLEELLISDVHLQALAVAT